MNLKNNANYRIIDRFNVAEIANEIAFLGESVWRINETRQKEFPNHKETQSIFIKDFPFEWKGHGYQLVDFSISGNLNPLTNKIINKLENHFNGKVGKCLYISLPAGKKVYPHRDYGYYLTNVHRCHIPIITNDRVEFFLNGEIVNMITGVCYEINNFNEHGVDNKGDSDRIHLLVDIIPMTAFK